MNDDTPRRLTARSLAGSVLRSIGLHRLTVRFTQAEARRAEKRAPAVWRSALNVALESSSAPTLVAGTVDPLAVPVIICLWARPDRLPDILAQLSAQDGASVRLILWNNAPTHSPGYLTQLHAWGAQGSLKSIEFSDSAANLGGIARFVAARKLVREGYEGPFITLDDDENVTPTFAKTLLAAHVPGGIAGWWAFRSGEDYWDREPALPGEPATYVGTGGAVFDSSIVADLGFFSELPARFGFMEDIWACHWVRRNGGTLTKAPIEIEFVQLELNQHHSLIAAKREFVRYLAT